MTQVEQPIEQASTQNTRSRRNRSAAGKAAAKAMMLPFSLVAKVILAIISLGDIPGYHDVHFKLADCTWWSLRIQPDSHLGSRYHRMLCSTSARFNFTIAARPGQNGTSVQERLFYRFHTLGVGRLAGRIGNFDSFDRLQVFPIRND